MSWRIAAQFLADSACEISWQLPGRKSWYRKNLDMLVGTHKWVFIVGCNNSGTSILQRIFDASGQVSTMEFEGQRYTKVLPRAWRRGHERVWTEYKEDLVLQPGDRAMLKPRLLHDWLRSLAKPVNSIVVEKTPANVLRMEWLQECFPDSCFIGLVRNGYAVAEGIRRKSNKSLERAARHWQAANATLLENCRGVNRYLEISYEEITEHPASSSARIAAFIGIDSTAIENAMSGEFAFSTVHGKGRLELHNLNADSIARLSQADIDIIRNNAAEMLDYFGYTPD